MPNKIPATNKFKGTMENLKKQNTTILIFIFIHILLDYQLIFNKIISMKKRTLLTNYKLCQNKGKFQLL